MNCGLLKSIVQAMKLRIKVKFNQSPPGLFGSCQSNYLKKKLDFYQIQNKFSSLNIPKQVVIEKFGKKIVFKTQPTDLGKYPVLIFNKINQINSQQDYKFGKNSIRQHIQYQFRRKLIEQVNGKLLQKRSNNYYQQLNTDMWFLNQYIVQRQGRKSFVINPNFTIFMLFTELMTLVSLQNMQRTLMRNTYFNNLENFISINNFGMGCPACSGFNILPRRPQLVSLNLIDQMILPNRIDFILNKIFRDMSAINAKQAVYLLNETQILQISQQLQKMQRLNPRTNQQFILQKKEFRINKQQYQTKLVMVDFFLHNYAPYIGLPVQNNQRKIFQQLVSKYTDPRDICTDQIIKLVNSPHKCSSIIYNFSSNQPHQGQSLSQSGKLYLNKISQLTKDWQ